MQAGDPGAAFSGGATAAAAAAARLWLTGPVARCTGGVDLCGTTAAPAVCTTGAIRAAANTGSVRAARITKDKTQTMARTKARCQVACGWWLRPQYRWRYRATSAAAAAGDAQPSKHTGAAGAAERVARTAAAVLDGRRCQRSNPPSNGGNCGCGFGDPASQLIFGLWNGYDSGYVSEDAAWRHECSAVHSGSAADGVPQAMMGLPAQSQPQQPQQLPQQQKMPCEPQQAGAAATPAQAATVPPTVAQQQQQAQQAELEQAQQQAQQQQWRQS
jgi:hypothetical protein